MINLQKIMYISQAWNLVSFLLLVFLLNSFIICCCMSKVWQLLRMLSIYVPQEAYFFKNSSSAAIPTACGNKFTTASPTSDRTLAADNGVTRHFSLLFHSQTSLTAHKCLFHHLNFSWSACAFCVAVSLTDMPDIFFYKLRILKNIHSNPTNLSYLHLSSADRSSLKNVKTIRD